MPHRHEVPDAGDTDPIAPPAVVEVPFTDAFDLHTFSPSDVKELVTDYLELARAAGFAEVRIIHGKGTGALRRLVHAVASRHPAVLGFAHDEARGGWGATVVALRPRGPAGEGSP